MRAIETIYDSHRFRSRHEARWAVFFNALGIRYEYETEGFVLGDIRYLPDFYLPSCKMWIEIKPGDGQASDAEKRKPYELAQALMQETPDRGYGLVLLIEGLPGEDRYQGTCWEWMSNDSGGGVNEWHAVVFAQCRKCDEIFIASSEEGFATTIQVNSDCHTEQFPLEHYGRVHQAYEAALMARFEHGERDPKIPKTIRPQPAPPPMSKAEQKEVIGQYCIGVMLARPDLASDVFIILSAEDFQDSPLGEVVRLLQSQLGNLDDIAIERIMGHSPEDVQKILRMLQASARESEKLDRFDRKSAHQMALRYKRLVFMEVIQALTEQQRELEKQGNREGARAIRIQAQAVALQLHALDKRQGGI